MLGSLDISSQVWSRRKTDTASHLDELRSSLSKDASEMRRRLATFACPLLVRARHTVLSGADTRKPL